jgi:hypothetical protein
VRSKIQFFSLVISVVSVVAVGAQGTQNSSRDQQAVPASKAPPLILRGGVEHSERLDPVEPQLQAGAVFNAQAIPMREPNNEWYWIPSWYSGQKHADYETILSDYDFRSGTRVDSGKVITNRQDLSIGFQPDKNGQVWEFKRAPYTTTVEWDKYFQTMFVRVRDPIRVAPDSVIIRLVQTSVMVDKTTQRILNTQQQEQFNTYIPAGPGIVQIQTSIKSFASDGSPLVQETSARMVVDRAPFRPIDNYQGRDMRTLFRDFMISHGHAYLLPPELAPSQPGQPTGTMNVNVFPEH